MKTDEQTLREALQRILVEIHNTDEFAMPLVTVRQIAEKALQATNTPPEYETPEDTIELGAPDTVPQWAVNVAEKGKGAPPEGWEEG